MASTSATAQDAQHAPVAKQATKPGLIGPGLVLLLSVIGPGDFVSNAVTGATHGTSLLWALALALLFRYIWLDTSARYVMATGQTLMQGYRELHSGLAWLLLIAVVGIRSTSNLYKLVLLGNLGNSMYPISGDPNGLAYSLAIAAVCYFAAARGGYQWLDKYVKYLVAVMGAGLCCALILSKPDWGSVLRGLTHPVLPAEQGAYSTLLLLLALIGTEAGSLTNVTYSYFMRRKGWTTPDALKAQRIDLLTTVTAMFLMGAMIQTVAASTLKVNNLIPQNTKDLAPMFSVGLGVAGGVIFGFGITASALGGLLATSTGYSMLGADLWSQLRETKPEHRTRIEQVLLGIFFTVPCLFLLAGAKPVWLALMSSSVMAFLIPVLATALLIIANRKTRMGALVNGWFANGVLVVLIVVSSVLIAVNVWEWVGRA